MIARVHNEDHKDITTTTAIKYIPKYLGMANVFAGMSMVLYKDADYYCRNADSYNLVRDYFKVKMRVKVRLERPKWARNDTRAQSYG